MTLSARTILAAHLVGLCAVLVPVVLFTYPPLVDFPAIVARMYVLHAVDDPGFAANYEVHWGYVPYLATDLVLPLLFRAVDPLVAGRIWLGVTLVLTALAPAVLHWRLHGRISPWPLLGYLLVFNHLVFWGFLNYILAAPLIVLGFLAWLETEEWHLAPRMALFTGIAFGLMTCHLFAWGAFGLLILGQLAPERDLKKLVLGGVPFGITFVLWRLLPTPGDGAGVFTEASDEFRYGDFGERVRDVAAPLNFDWLASDVALLTVGACFLYWLVRERALTVHPRMVGPLVAVAIGTVLMPHMVLGGWGTMRLPVLFSMVLVGSIDRVELDRRSFGVIAATAVALFAFKTGQVTAEWSRCQPVVQEVRSALAQVEEGSRLVSVLDRGDQPKCLRRPAYSHLATYAVLDRKAFVPQLLSLSTVFTADRHTQLADAVSGPLDPLQLEDPALVSTVREHADYLLYMHRGADVKLPEHGFEVFVEGSWFVLYRTAP